MTCNSGRRFGRLITGLVLALGLAFIVRSAGAQDMSRAQSRFFVTSDGVRLHYLEAGPRRGHTIVFVPGWTMPAWIWQPQIARFLARYHVVAFDPRGQGDSGSRPSRLRAGAARPGHRRADRPSGAGAGAAGRLVARRAGHAGLCPRARRSAARRPGAGGQFGGRGAGAAAVARPRRAAARVRRTQVAHAAASCASMFHQPAERGLSGPADRGDAAHAGMRLPRAARLSGAAQLLARRDLFDRQAGALRRAARSGWRRRANLRAQSAGHRDRGVPRRRPCAVRR